MTDSTALPPAPPHPSALAKNPDLAKKVDERVSLDKKTSQWIFEDSKSNSEYYYNFILEKWIPKYTEELSEATTDAGDKRTHAPDDEEENKKNIKRLKKEKLQAMRDEIKRLKGNKRPENDDNESSGLKQSNNAIYVSNLPSNITKDELAETFSKYGILSEDTKTGGPRIKMYYDDNNVFKNEALIVYLSEDSVPLAIEMLHDSYISAPSNGPKIKVERAQFNAKPSSSQKRVLTAEEKHQLTQRKEMLKRKLTDWDDSTENSQDKSNAQKIWSKIVIAKNMFRVEELKEDPLLQMDLKEDIQEECDKFDIGNDITSIKFYDISGVITIKFKKPELADKCIEVFNGRFFDGLKLSIEHYNGEQFEASKSEGEGEASDRINDFGNWIEKKEIKAQNVQ